MYKGTFVLANLFTSAFEHYNELIAERSPSILLSETVCIRNMSSIITYLFVPNTLIHREPEIKIWSVLRGELHSFLLLSLITKPYAHHIFLQV